jgi:hypothetical protein
VVNQQEEAWRLEAKSFYMRADGDFNGDGTGDYAEIKISCDGGQTALFVFIQNINGTFRRHLLASVPNAAAAAYGVRTVPPGIYAGACQKGYFECIPGQSKADIANESIEFFKFEGATSIFYYDNKRKSFSRIWIND